MMVVEALSVVSICLRRKPYNTMKFKWILLQFIIRTKRKQRKTINLYNEKPFFQSYCSTFSADLQFNLLAKIKMTEF